MTVIIQKEDPVLRRHAQEVPIEDIGKDKIKKLLADMSTTLEKCEDGVALAAPQIGVSLRVFVISPRAYSIQQGDQVNEEPKKEIDKLIYINPVITKRSTKKVILDEGCLSVRNVFGKIKRHEKVSIMAYDENGKKFTRGATGLLSEIFQHETDHLDGIIFIDSAKDLILTEEKDPIHVK